MNACADFLMTNSSAPDIFSKRSPVLKIFNRSGSMPESIPPETISDSAPVCDDKIKIATIINTETAAGRTRHIFFAIRTRFNSSF